MASHRANGHASTHHAAAHVARRNLYHDYRNLKSTLNKTQKDLKSSAYAKSLDLQDKVVDYVSEQPFKSLGIALLSGFIFGMIFRR